jgi:peptidoglycan L-alanyl-D-glutamate endopeptidase CwlK
MPRESDTSVLHPILRSVLPELDGQLFRAGIPLQVYEAGRSPFRQAEFYAIGRGTGTPGKHVTRAKAWGSFHQFGLAVDYVFKIDGKWTWDEPTPGMWKQYQAIGESLGLRALPFETPHLEWPVALADLQAGRYPDGGDDAWRNWLEGWLEQWGSVARDVGGITHPAAPPLMIDRPAVA